MKSFIFSLATLLCAISMHAQTFEYADTIVTPQGDFMLETDEEPIEVSFNQQTQFAEDGGAVAQLNFYPSGARFASPARDESTSFSINPNPANDQATLFLKNGGSILTVRINDLSGRTVSTQTFYSADGAYLRTLELSGYSPGVYFIDIHTNGGHFSHKLVKQ